MALEAPKWFKETVKTKVHHRLQASGPYLEGTMMRGDIEGGTVKFPRVGRVEMYEIFGTIEDIDVREANLDTITATFRDFELPIRWRTQDGWDMGPNQMDTFSKMVANGLNRQKDRVKLEALKKFADANPEVQSENNSGSVIDIKMVDELIANIYSNGGDDDMMLFLPLPEMLFRQLCYYKEFNNLDWVGADNLGFAKKTRCRKKMRDGCHIFTMPDELFYQQDANNWQLYMWAQMSMGQEARHVGEAEMWKQPNEKGTPIYYKKQLRDTAVGIEPLAVKRLIVSKQTTITRPA